MSKKGWIAVIVGIGVAILVTGGLVIAAGGGSRCETKGVCNDAAGQISYGEAGCDGSGECDGSECKGDGTCDGSGECDGNCESESVQNQGEESNLTNSFSNANGVCDGSCGDCENQECAANQAPPSGIVNSGGACDGSCVGGSVGGCDGSGSCDGNCVGHGGRDKQVKYGN